MNKSIKENITRLKYHNEDKNIYFQEIKEIN